MMNQTIAKARQKERQRERRERIAVDILGSLLVSERILRDAFGVEIKTTGKHADLAIEFADALIARLDKDA